MHMVDFITQGPLWSYDLGPIRLAVTKPMLVSTGFMILLSLIFIFLGRNLKLIPETRRQLIAETIYSTIRSLVDSNMGSGYYRFIPFIGALILFLLGQNFSALFGFKPPTSSFSTAFGLGLISFLIIHINAVKTGGLRGYAKSYVEPMPFLLPITLLERLIFPVSLSLRLFGNVLAATVIMSLIYGSLMQLNFFAMLVIPLPFHAYFDLFEGGLQAVIFTFLTMIQIKLLAEESTEHEPVKDIAVETAA